MHVQLHENQDATSQLCQAWKLFFVLALFMMIFPSGFEVKVLFFEKVRLNISLCRVSKLSLKSGISLGVKIYVPGPRQIFMRTDLNEFVDVAEL